MFGISYHASFHTALKKILHILDYQNNRICHLQDKTYIDKVLSDRYSS